MADHVQQTDEPGDTRREHVQLVAGGDAVRLDALGPCGLLSLQRLVGNRAVTEYIQQKADLPARPLAPIALQRLVMMAQP